MVRKGIRFAIDRGGTFTDCLALVPNDMLGCNGNEALVNSGDYKVFVTKLLSEDPQNYSDAPREGIRRLLEKIFGEAIPGENAINTQHIESIRMGTTVATNALLERKGEPFVFVTTTGFKDLLLIGNQTRPNIFDVSAKRPGVLFDDVIEINERVTVSHNGVNSSNNDETELRLGISDEHIQILSPLDISEVHEKLSRAFEKGYRNISICFLHSYTWKDHEIKVAQIAKELGFKYITTSSEIMPMVKCVPRGHSSCADAYLTPCIQKYIHSFSSGFDQGMSDGSVSVQFMQSDGGLTNVDSFSGVKAILSGPAGGVVGYGKTSFSKVTKDPVIGFDMGGTSTDVSRFNGELSHIFETTTAGVTIQAPQLDINTIAAGGGSIIKFENGLFHVGPESAGAYPGPACYRKGGPLTVTDANLLLGRISIKHFPHIFGPEENLPLDLSVVTKKFEQLSETIAAETGKKLTPEEVALGFIKVANESMCRPIRALTQGKGYDTSSHILASFGGAGGQHAFAIAENLGISLIHINRFSSVLSAYGMALADTIYELQEPASYTFSFPKDGVWKSNEIIAEDITEKIKTRLVSLSKSCRKSLNEQGFMDKNIRVQLYLNIRYKGTDTAIMIRKPKNSWNFINDFLEQHQLEYGFLLVDRDIVVDDIRARGIGEVHQLTPPEVLTRKEIESLLQSTKPLEGKPNDYNLVYFENGIINVPVYHLDDICCIGSGEEIAKIMGPALVLDSYQTLVVSPNASALITNQTVYMVLNSFAGTSSALRNLTSPDPIYLSVFSHRFMSIAEQMGLTLQRTSVSTNIKERLDFSCAIFGPDAGLVANAPHIPVHLGSMQEAVKCQKQLLGPELYDGDVIMTNHPASGGSHLPDITIITPVFRQGEIIFFVASRGHHADIGGLSPGSMPPHSKELFQEGAFVKSLKIVRNGFFQEESVRQILLEEPAKYPGCTGTRNLRDNISDLKAQIAANQKGIQLLQSLVEEYGLNIVHTYMAFIQQNADVAVREMLKRVARDKDSSHLHALEYMDDGSPIELNVSLNPDGTAIFDFSGTGPEVYGNINAPRSVTYSAIIYCLRCMISSDMPLNQGCLKPITIVIPSNSLLSPSERAAVVGGNVLTSQRLVDVIFKAFETCAASQGCCNNLTFGTASIKDQCEGWGYYETIAGGSGAGPDWKGKDGIHMHMTNTRITDPEILERRYPVLLREFSIRSESGGKGQNRGGHGIIRDIEFLDSNTQVSILSERRVFEPYGLKGGGNGKRGLNLWLKKLEAKDHNMTSSQPFPGYAVLNLGGKNTMSVHKGDRIRLYTPGGGGWGKETASR